jgi:hypothetical protein
MKKAALLVLLGLISVFVADCVIGYPNMGPPPPREERMTGQRGPGYVWISGYWSWTGGGYSWRSGHWAKAKGGRNWAPGRWEQKGKKWVWRGGQWR